MPGENQLNPDIVNFKLNKSKIKDSLTFRNL